MMKNAITPHFQILISSPFYYFPSLPSLLYWNTSGLLSWADMERVAKYNYLNFD